MSIRRAAPVALAFLAACQGQDAPPPPSSGIQELVDQYATVRLTSDLSHLSESDREVVRLLIEAVQPMDEVFWTEAYGDQQAALALAGGDEAMRRYVEILSLIHISEPTRPY